MEEASKPVFIELSRPKRIASLDFQRGLAIWMMVLLHSIQEIYDVSWAVNLNELLQKPIIVIIAVALLGLLSGWAGYFLLISAIVNSYSMTKKVNKGYSAEQSLLKQVITGVGILVIAIISESVIGYHGYLGHALSGHISWKVTDFWASPLAKGFYTMETLQAIAWCMIINAIVQYFMLRKKGYEKFKRNMIVYLILTFSIIVASFFMWKWVDNMDWKTLLYEGKTLVWPDEKVQAFNHSFKAYVFTVLAGDMEPLFPFLATSFAGSMIGLALAKPVKRLPR